MALPTGPRYAFVCPACLADESVSSRRLVLAAEDAQVLVICLSCDATLCLTLELATVALLRAAGVATLSATSITTRSQDSQP